MDISIIKDVVPRLQATLNTYMDNFIHVTCVKLENDSFLLRIYEGTKLHSEIPLSYRDSLKVCDWNSENEISEFQSLIDYTLFGIVEDFNYRYCELQTA